MEHQKLINKTEHQKLIGKKIISYYRVSTKQQGSSGLGLESQKNIVLNFCGRNPDFEFTEIESGTNNKRIEILKAIEMTKKVNGVLVIAKLDRLSRNLKFVMNLLESKISFICCDMPDANEFTIHIIASVAQQEVKMISERTKASLKVLKDRGVKLGSPQNLTREAAIKSAKLKKEKFKEDFKVAISYAEMMKDSGSTLQEIADKLNHIGIRTTKGFLLKTENVRRLLAAGRDCVSVTGGFVSIGIGSGIEEFDLSIYD